MTTPPSATAMPPSLTLIVAATRTMGIGLNGTLPWPSLKQELAYFARVTKHPPPSLATAESNGHENKSKGHINAVIMGRKTWESIPRKFRPLRGRVNVVVSSRSAGNLEFTGRENQEVGGRGGRGEKEEIEGPIAASSLGEGLEILLSIYNPSISLLPNQYPSAPAPMLYLGRVFIIGGAQLYASALQYPQCDRILHTEIHTAFECDTFFPVDLFSSEGNNEEEEGGWVKRRKEELDEWAGEEVPGGIREENGVRYEFGMWERRRSRS